MKRNRRSRQELIHKARVLKDTLKSLYVSQKTAKLIKQCDVYSSVIHQLKEPSLTAKR
jgi:hypothetical protein